MIIHIHYESGFLPRVVIRITCGAIQKCNYLCLWPHSYRSCGRKVLQTPKVRERLGVESPVMRLHSNSSER